MVPAVEPLTLSLVCLVVFVAFLIEAAMGFGATVVAVALGAFLIPIRELLPPFVALNLVLSSFLCIRYRHDIRWRLLLVQVVPLMALGMPLGIWLFGAGDENLLTGLFGAFVVVVSAVELCRMARPAPISGPGDRALNTGARWLLLLAGGAAHGAWATGGPMAVYVAGRELPDKGGFRSTLSCLWLILNGILMVSYATAGELCAGTATLMAWLAGSLALGLVIGVWLHERVNPRVFRVMVFALLLVAGALLSSKAL